MHMVMPKSHVSLTLSQQTENDKLKAEVARQKQKLLAESTSASKAADNSKEKAAVEEAAAAKAAAAAAATSQAAAESRAAEATAAAEAVKKELADLEAEFTKRLNAAEKTVRSAP